MRLPEMIVRPVLTGKFSLLMTRDRFLAGDLFGDILLLVTFCDW
jgi:hypothetical protein